jgi:hypothetical protein
VVSFGPEIGRAIGHSPHAILLAEADGRPLTYYGLLTGYSWPQATNGGVGAASGIVTPDAAALLASFQQGQPPDYFVVTDFVELSRQPQLKQVLSHYQVIAQTPAYVIYDLRQPAQ